MKRHKYRLDIATASGMTQDESHRCLRAMLKAMLRQWDVKCLAAIPIEPAGDDNTADTEVGNSDSRNA